MEIIFIFIIVLAFLFYVMANSSANIMMIMKYGSDWAGPNESREGGGIAESILLIFSIPFIIIYIMISYINKSKYKKYYYIVIFLIFLYAIALYIYNLNTATVYLERANKYYKYENSEKKIFIDGKLYDIVDANEIRTKINLWEGTHFIEVKVGNGDTIRSSGIQVVNYKKGTKHFLGISFSLEKKYYSDFTAELSLITNEDYNLTNYHNTSGTEYITKNNSYWNTLDSWQVQYAAFIIPRLSINLKKFKVFKLKNDNYLSVYSMINKDKNNNNVYSYDITSTDKNISSIIKMNSYSTDIVENMTDEEYRNEYYKNDNDNLIPFLDFTLLFEDHLKNIYLLGSFRENIESYRKILIEKLNPDGSIVKNIQYGSNTLREGWPGLIISNRNHWARDLEIDAVISSGKSTYILCKKYNEDAPFHYADLVYKICKIDSEMNLEEKIGNLTVPGGIRGLSSVVVYKSGFIALGVDLHNNNIYMKYLDMDFNLIWNKNISFPVATYETKYNYNKVKQLEIAAVYKNKDSLIVKGKYYKETGKESTFYLEIK